MPTISVFYGIVVRMFFNDHAPPHFHALYGEFQATITIESLQLLEGELPSRALRLVLEWAELNRPDLLENWERCRRMQQPRKLEPLA
jgi:hypothetical protein